MIDSTTKSVNKILIRLTNERWKHITYSHKEINFTNFKNVLGVVEKPDMVLVGDSDELLAVSKISRRKQWFVVVYKEGKDDGFVITAYVTSDIKWLLKRKVKWIKK